MKSFVLSLVIWAGLFGPFWYVAHERFFPPGDWIGALVVSLAITLGIGGLRRAWLGRRDAFLLSRPDGPLRDGRRVAIAGTIEPVGEPLTAPLSGRACLAYDYEIGHMESPPLQFIGKARNQSQMPREVIDLGGYGLAPSVIRSGVREVRLLAFPGLEGFPRSATKDLAIDRARSYVEATTFEKQSLISGIGDMNRLVSDRSGSIRTDWRMTSHDDLESSFFREQILPVGAKACVIGRYSEKEPGIVPEANAGGVRVIRGTREQGLSFLRDKVTGSWIAALLFLFVPGAVLWGILTYREHYLVEHDKESVASSLKDLAAQYRSQGRFADAELLYRRSLAMKEAVLGPNHLALAGSLDDLAQMHLARNQFAQAEPLLRRALAIREKALRPNDPALADALKYLADLYDGQGQYAKADPLHDKWVAITEKALRPDNPNVALSINALAESCDRQGRYARAEEFYKRSLAIQEKTLGADHENVAATLNGLAAHYDSQGRYAQAEPLYERALAIWEKVLGPNGDRVAMTLDAMAVDYRKTGRAPDAAELERHAKSIWATKR